MNRILKPLLLATILLMGAEASAQTNMHIHYKDGTHVAVPVERIDYVTFADAENEPSGEAALTGSWLWGKVEAGYYELLTFNGDRTYTGYDNYFSYGFDTQTYGRYWQTGSLLSLQSNGYGYQFRYDWFVIGLTTNALEVMTQMGKFVYYKLQPEVIRLKAGDSPVPCGDGETIVFADGVTVRAVDNQLQGLYPGTTYIQKCTTATNTILAYKVIVE